MGRIKSVARYLVGRARDFSPVGQAERAYEAGESTLKFEWPNIRADMWIDLITSSGMWQVESIEHPFELDIETDEPKDVVRVTFVRVDR